MPQVILIAARSLNNVIGCNNSLPWKLPSDLKHFRSLTTNNVVIMGRKTFTSLGEEGKKPLPNRYNIVISSNRASIQVEGLFVCSSVQEALETGLEALRGYGDIYVIGGEQVYRSCLEYADQIILSTIQKACQGGDTFFPEIDLSIWEKNKETCVSDKDGYMLDNPGSKGLEYVIEYFERKNRQV